ncbi:bifunctional DNA-binding transcriptional regulator/O6-methylguanine-DNA methyltransferase Ada [Amaricoccus solimangrovi]|uniref:methylated-DNA--[protein]-cysteine S-methyltransferase n=2 Tax=Amaricoccus solimangrovi TaxID=2589815 RepID=A0A501WZT2_9RHOB|nr:bifunctional DNA-binding transcriptional regulator/O6-methylguanine-DNA methyltransferase Ada [Amaricoccus solimangrovi]
MAPEETETRDAPEAAGEGRWRAVAARDAGADGRFVFAVTTTGIYCRPSCPARRPRRAHVRFFDTPAAAEAAGFRPCLRCHPKGPSRAEANAALVAAACRELDAAETAPDLPELARRIGLSPAHLHRLFKAATGLTPRAYAAGRRAGRLRAELSGGAGVTEALYAAGYGSAGRLYAESDAVLGMTPGAYRDGGADVAITWAVGASGLGPVLVARTERGVCAILMGAEAEAPEAALARRFPKARLVPGDADFAELVRLVIAFVEAPRTGLDLPLDLRGTAFQRRVWEALRAIPPGETASYAEIARRIGAPGSARAVAGACAANPVAVAVPCHRVLRGDGALSGYRWGVERKRDLLARERG